MIQETPPVPSTQPETPSPRVYFPHVQPLVTYILLGLTVLVYILQVGSEFFLGLDLPAAYGVKYNPLIEAGQYWRLLTPMLLHGSLIHLGFNMYALYILGRRLENFFGHYRFLALYLISGFAGNILSMLLTKEASLGSSTAIFGLLGAEGVFIYQHRELLGNQAKHALRQIIQVAAINLVIGLSPGIDNWGHVGGLLGGVAFIWLAGPVLQVGGIYPSLVLEDTREPGTVGRVFLILGLALATLAGGIIYWRIQN